MSAWMFVWAIVSACAGAVHSYSGLVVVRFFLGITEAPVSPTCSLYSCLIHFQLTLRAVLPRCNVHARHILYQKR